MPRTGVRFVAAFARMWESLATPHVLVGLSNLTATLLARVVPALLHYMKSSRKSVVQKRGNHRDEPGGGEIQQALANVATA